MCLCWLLWLISTHAVILLWGMWTVKCGKCSSQTTHQMVIEYYVSQSERHLNGTWHNTHYITCFFFLSPSCPHNISAKIDSHLQNVQTHHIIWYWKKKSDLLKAQSPHKQIPLSCVTELSQLCACNERLPHNVLQPLKKKTIKIKMEL